MNQYLTNIQSSKFNSLNFLYYFNFQHKFIQSPSIYHQLLIKTLYFTKKLILKKEKKDKKDKKDNKDISDQHQS